MSDWEGYFKEDLVCVCWLEHGGHWSGEAGTGINSSTQCLLVPMGGSPQFPGGKVAVLQENIKSDQQHSLGNAGNVHLDLMAGQGMGCG